MADKAREWTDKELEKLERKIAKIYKQSEKEMKEKWDAYMRRGEKRLAKYESAYSDALKSGDDNLISEAKKQLQDANKSFTLKNKYYKEMVDSVTLDMAKTNQMALSYIHEQLPEIYAVNYAQANEIVKNLGEKYTLPNKNAIKNMVLDGKIETPFMNSKNFINIPKDQRWNTKFINSEVLQGIIQGEDIRKISKRIFPEIDSKTVKEGLSKKELKSLEKRNRQAALRNARTLVTGAENCGKWDSFKELDKRGVVQKKVWIATGDSRTRDAHLMMDGQKVDLDEKFEDGNGDELRYPADPQAKARTVYNCRCAMVTDIVGFRNKDGTIRYIDDVDEGTDLHDEQIAKEIERRKGIERQTQIVKKEIENITIEPDAEGAMKGIQKIKGEINVKTIAKSVNPRIDTDPDFRAYSTNCANCVVATEARYRGYDVIARKRDFSRDTHIHQFYYDNRQEAGSWTDSFKDMIGEPISAKRKTEVAQAVSQKMKEYGEGSRAVIFVQWDKKNVGHYFNVVNERGDIIFFDSQNGTIGDVVKDYFLSARPSQTRIWRTDDKEITDFIRKVVEPNE